MKDPKPVSSAQQRFTFTRRNFFVGGVQAAFGLLLSGRMAYIAVAENDKYTLKAENNRVSLTLIPPRRGWFIDRYGKPIATNRADFRVDLIPDRIVDQSGTVATLRKLLNLSDDDVERINRELKQARGFQPVQVADGLDYDSYARVSVRLPELPGVSPRQGFSRFYPSGPAVGHLLGYVGVVSAEEYQESKNPLLITPGFKVGKDGLEKAFEQNLQGTAGAKRVEVTARGKIVRELATRPDTPGKPLRLTIDVDLHNYAARRLGRESGAVVVIDCLTGDILTMASMPSFDPNSFSDGIGVTEYKWLQQNQRIPLLNKALQGLYPPGSTLKPMVAIALLDLGIDPAETIFCNGGYTLGNRRFQCLGRHGTTNMADAIKVSCNTYFYTMGRRVGYDAIAPVARQLGLGQEYDLPFISQRYGTVPDSAWIKKKYSKNWSQADTLNATIGQGYVLTNPLQLALMTARIASGRMLTPAIIAAKRPVAAALPYAAEHLALVRDGMDRVVNAGGGTGVASRLPLDGITMAGKTGTAQVRGLGKGGGDAWKYRDHGLFVCFAPVNDPRYAAAVVIEHGVGGARAAAPVAKDVLTFLYDREKAMATLQTLESAWGGTPEERMARELSEYQISIGTTSQKTSDNDA